MGRMRLILLPVVIMMCAFCSVAQVRLSEVGPGYCRTSVNTAVFRAGSLVTHGEEQYVSYLSPITKGPSTASALRL